jgi:CBS domain containing-hemolysin-like protein
LLRIDEIAGLTGFRAHDGDYETIGGLVMNALGHVPAEGDSVELRAFDPDSPVNNPPRWQATVARMDGRRVDLIDLVKIRAPKSEGPA